MKQLKKVALLMLSNKEGIENFTTSLMTHGYEILGSTGTAKKLTDSNIPATDIATMVGDPILNHKVVSLSREIHAGLLAETIEELDELERLGILKIDLLCVDFYNLEDAINHPGATAASVRKETDIGGPTAVSSAAKGRRPVICEVSQREELLRWIEAGEPDREAFIDKLEAHAHFFVSRYRGLSAKFLGGDQYLVMHGQKHASLKYGENPHQKNANLYALPGDDPLALHKFKIAYSGPASYVTMTDVDRVIDTVCRIAAAFDVNNVRKQRIAVAVKHGNACGAAYSVETVDAIKKCVQGDREAVLGAVIACNFDIGEYEIEAIFKSHTDGKKWGMIAGIVCASITETALHILQSRNLNCIVFTNPGFEHSHMGMHSLDTTPKMRAVRGGMLVQDAPTFVPNFDRDVKGGICTIYGGAFPEQKKASLLLAWAICSTSNSNTITVVHNGQLLGNAVGQQKRVASSELAMKKALFATGGDEAPFLQSVAWSDSYFPYPDGIEVLQKHGISIVGATTGSKRDDLVIEFCKSNGVTFITYPDAVARGFSNH